MVVSDWVGWGAWDKARDVTMEKSGAACTDLMVAEQAVPFSIAFVFTRLNGGSYEMHALFPSTVAFLCSCDEYSSPAA